MALITPEALRTEGSGFGSSSRALSLASRLLSKSISRIFGGWTRSDEGWRRETKYRRRRKVEVAG